MLEQDRVNDPCGLFAMFQVITGCHAVDGERIDLLPAHGRELGTETFVKLGVGVARR